jgi:hypothetical protein
MEPKDDTYNGYINLTDYNHAKDSILTTTGTGQGLWSQLNTSAGNTFSGTTSNSFRDPYVDLYTRMDKLELNEKLLRLKILGLEGKFDKDEVANIRKMLMSEDEASKTLADSIIENA